MYLCLFLDWFPFRRGRTSLHLVVTLASPNQLRQEGQLLAISIVLVVKVIIAFHEKGTFAPPSPLLAN